MKENTYDKIEQQLNMNVQMKIIIIILFGTIAIFELFPCAMIGNQTISFSQILIACIQNNIPDILGTVGAYAEGYISIIAYLVIGFCILYIIGIFLICLLSKKGSFICALVFSILELLYSAFLDFMMFGVIQELNYSSTAILSGLSGINVFYFYLVILRGIVYVLLIVFSIKGIIGKGKTEKIMLMNKAEKNRFNCECPKCGMKVKINQKYCSRCGLKL